MDNKCDNELKIQSSLRDWLTYSVIDDDDDLIRVWYETDKGLIRVLINTDKSTHYQLSSLSTTSYIIHSSDYV
jgi:hypothetical protein